MSKLSIHAIIIALNEEDFITETIKPIYKYCSGISVVTQYDRDYYGKLLKPDNTINKVLGIPDPEGKIHLVVRRYNDETASRNHEMMAILSDASKGIQPHGVPIAEIKRFHKKPDYFLICDADEIFDIDTFPNILNYLALKKPNAMRISGYNYFFNWNRREPKEQYVHKHFGFVKAGILFQQRRVLNWNESRINHICKKLGLPSLGSQLFHFIDCPWEIGMMHHAGYVRKNEAKMLEKLSKHSHLENHDSEMLKNFFIHNYGFVNTNDLPRNIQKGNWPHNFFEKE